MLKRLELIGFKSFADKSRFDFAPGITAVVGPNGSGKSNVVDAVRWILGEQSAKSLRGGEMADVIFNGSASRKGLGMAEVTMTFDNARRTLATDADEVRVTRRVYRDGEGEYLVNGLPSRLKDVKELFLGSGAGAHAYSIIEQGRVDALLQASTADRRAIFEEAAGISRFKAKKVETLRKLERVEQNLQRVRDVVAEVEKQLRTARLQAAKAQRWQEHSDRLKDLRIGLGLREWRDLTARLDAERGVLDGLRGELAESLARRTAWEDEERRLEAALARTEDEMAAGGRGLAEVRQRIAALEASRAHDWTAGEDLAAEAARLAREQLDRTAQVRALAEAAAAAEHERETTAVQAELQRRLAETLAAELAEVDSRVAAAEQLLQVDRGDQPERERQAAGLHNEVANLAQKLERDQAEAERKRRKIAEKRGEHAANEQALASLARDDADLQQRIADKRRDLEDRVGLRDRLRADADGVQQALDGLRLEHSGLSARIEVLEGLERSQEGLGAGVREVVALLERERAVDAPDPRLSDVVIGLVADLLTVPHEVAPLVDLALGDAAQRFLARDAAALDAALARLDEPFVGRVSFVPLDPPREPDDFDLRIGDAAVTTADRLVRCDRPGLEGLPRQLLGDTLLVPDLVTARRLATTGGRWRFVTHQGELLERDGGLTVGTHHAETGVLSRKSELRELREEAAALVAQIASLADEVAELRDQASEQDAPILGLGREIDLLAGEAGDLGSRIGQVRQRQEWLLDEVRLTAAELAAAEHDLAALAAALVDARRRAAAAEDFARELKARIARTEAAKEEARRERIQREQANTAGQRRLAQALERWKGAEAALARVTADLGRERHELARVDDAVRQAAARLSHGRLALLEASAALADGFRDKEGLERQAADLAGRRDCDRERRRELAEMLQGLRAEWQERQDQAHTHELAARDLENRRDAQAARLREDYQIELAELANQPSCLPPPLGGRAGVGGELGDVEAPTPHPNPPPQGGRGPDGSAGASPSPTEETPDPFADPAAVHEEIAELRRKLARLGSVNLDALQELATVEARAADMQAQYDDLTAAQRDLLAIIEKVNADSRKLFSDVYEAVRANFVDLFRKLFAGGMADVVLENPDDVLESGIEIVARPPGKDLRSIALMSGGERTLTAIALLLAIFRSKPSPFCLLDEVDAALDEANTQRLATVLREFCDRSQFIVVTHKKRTMAVADVLYGITMQESGVSKQVAVRFEDWQGPSARAA